MEQNQGKKGEKEEAEVRLLSRGRQWLSVLGNQPACVVSGVAVCAWQSALLTVPVSSSGITVLCGCVAACALQSALPVAEGSVSC